jgi:hypothetical protein
LSDEVLEALRLRAPRGCELGFTEADVADLLGVSRETVSRWYTADAAGGPEAFPSDRTGRPVGSGRTLSDEQAARIGRRIDDHSPQELGSNRLRVGGDERTERHRPAKWLPGYFGRSDRRAQGTAFERT